MDSNSLKKILGKWQEPLKGNSMVEHTELLLKRLSWQYQNYGEQEIFPTQKQVFRAFRETNPDTCKLIIIAQDPYPTIAELSIGAYATGIAMGIPDYPFIKVPPTLEILKKELQRTHGDKIDISLFDNTLESWVKQGILLINSSLTVRKNKPGIHKKIWDEWTPFFFEALTNSKYRNIPVVSLGTQARINCSKGNVQNLTSFAHPAVENYPGNKRFIGNEIFKKMDEITRGQITWCS